MIMLLIHSFIIVSASPKIYFDIKTGLSELADLLPAKVGIAIFLEQSEWAGIREFGEDYSLRLKNYEKRKENNLITVSLDVEIRSPSFIRTGALLKRRRMFVIYRPEDDWTGVDSVRDAVERELDNTTKELRKGALYIGAEIIKYLEELKKREVI